MSSNLPFNAEAVEVNKSEGPLKINIVAISTALLGYSDCYIKVFGNILDHFGGALPLSVFDKVLWCTKWRRKVPCGPVL